MIARNPRIEIEDVLFPSLNTSDVNPRLSFNLFLLTVRVLRTCLHALAYS